jgi:hypothetical protein
MIIQLGPGKAELQQTKHPQAFMKVLIFVYLDMQMQVSTNFKSSPH